LKIIEALKIKEGEKYKTKGVDVANHLGVKKNAVYNSRRQNHKLDKIYCYDKASQIAEKTTIYRGDKDELQEIMQKIMESGKKYAIICEENG
jgi:outer membrane protein assembly factor BamA